ncbi:MAG: hydroxymethylglutaryl-CoA synthase family protein [Candidatus Lokiarchaeota archaeon]|nr:hydroxymethylglutaryl-CoA synthase family protein [Candidatus Lokiarchaeota archaeon]
MMRNGFLYSNIGIDSIGFHAPRYFIKLKDLARERKIDPEKYKKGLMAIEMRLPEINEDIISIGLKAGYNALIKGNISPKEIDALFVGTETITYAVKSVSNIFAELLEISPNSFTQDCYNACAGGTLALLNAIALIDKEVIKKALVISADISSYQIGSPSEPTQGSGAVALVISKNPRVAAFSEKFGKVSGNVDDFFRPAYEKNAKAFGHYSVDTYLDFQLRAYDDLINNVGDFYADFYTFHAPYSKLPIKCMQYIIQKRWINHINNLPRLKRNQIKSSILKKLDSFMHDITVLPEWLYLKLRERGFSSETLESLSHKLIRDIKGRVLPQLRVPSHFGNMYNASVWAQILYILENYARVNDTIYFGSYGSGATCISGLLKIKEDFKSVIDKSPKIDDFINNKERKTVQEYEIIKNGNFLPSTVLGEIIEHEQNQHRGFTLHFCDEGCIIPNIKGLNHCPKGHSGFHTRFFPLFAVLKSEPIENPDENNLTFLQNGLVRIIGKVKQGTLLEYELRRIENKNEKNFNAIGLLNWSPMYIPIQNVY